MIIIVLFLVTISAVLYLTSKVRYDDDAPFWKKLLEAISLKVVDFYYVTTPTKIVALFLRGIFNMYGIVALGYPTIKAFRQATSSKEFWKIIISWDEVSANMTYIFLIAATLVTTVYLILHRHEAKTTKAIMDTDERTKEIERQNQKIIKQNDEILNIVKGNGNKVIEHLLPLTVDNIKRLKLKTAYDYLSQMKKELENSGNKDEMLQAEVLYWMGSCSRYVGESERGQAEMSESYRLMKDSGKQNADIIGGMIYVLCRKENEQEARKLGEELRIIDSKNVWGWLPLLHFQDNLDLAYETIEKQTEIARLVLANELVIRQRETSIPQKLIEEYVLEWVTELSYDNLPIWVLNMSVALTRFLRSWRIMPKGMNLSTKDSEELYELTDIYLSKLGDTEIKNILPDTEYIHVVTGFCHDRELHWIDDMKKAHYSAGHKEVFYLSYAMMLMESGNNSEALKTLQGYGENVTIGILNYRMHVALEVGDFDDVAKVFEIAANKQILIEDAYVNYFISYARWNYDKVKDSAERLKFSNPLSKRVYDELLNLWAGKNVDVGFLQDNEDKTNPLFKPYIALAYQKYLSLDKALEIAKSCLPENGVDIRNYIYIDLLNSDILRTKELYHYLNTIRRNGFTEDDRLLSKELELAERIGDYEVAAETSAILSERHPEEIAYIEHNMIALNKIGGHKERILELSTRAEKHEMTESQIHNVFTVLNMEGATAEALEFLYQQIKKDSTRALRDEYFIATLQNEFSELIYKQEDIAKVGSYIMYNDGERDLYDTIYKGGVLDEFIGKKAGESIVLKKGSKEKSLTLIGVFSKYMKLAKEVAEEVSMNKSKTIVSIDSTEEEFKKDPLGVLQRIAGKTPEQKQAYETDLRNYWNGKLSLMAFVKTDHTICSCYDLLFNDFKVMSIPDGDIEFMGLKYRIDFSRLEYVLDLTTLIMLYEMDLLFGLELPKKMIIPKGIIQQIDDEIHYEKKVMPAFFGGKGIERLAKINAEKGASYFSVKLKDLKVWAEEHCDIQVAEDKLNLDMSKLRTAVSSLEVESMILANQGGRALMTEDWSFCITLGGVFPALSVSNLLYVTKNEKYREVADFMTSVNRVGQIVSGNYIYQQYEDMRDGKTNCWQQCLTNMEMNPHTYLAVIQAAMRISEGVITPGKMLALNSILTIMFKSIPEETSLKVYQSAFVRSDNKTYRTALADALRSVHPKYFSGV